MLIHFIGFAPLWLADSISWRKKFGGAADATMRRGTFITSEAVGMAIYDMDIEKLLDTVLALFLVSGFNDNCRELAS